MGRRIIFTGGGTAGHVTVNLALIPKFIAEGWEVTYIGSENGIEKQLVSELKKVQYYGISTGKLRRYFDWNNVKDPFRVMKGVYQAYRIIKELKPNVLFSKGGFVSVPVIIGAWLNRVPVIIHESDLTPGLANRIAMPFATKICITFPETKEHVKSEKAIHVGGIIREELKHGNATRGLTLCNFTRSKPVLLVMGGSQGSKKINETIRANLNQLLNDFQIVHICGKGQLEPRIQQKGYQQYEYLTTELPDVMAMADLVISRAGANSIFEFLFLRKPMLLIPLSKKASRGDQILNARSFEKAGYAHVLMEEEITNELFMQSVRSLVQDRQRMIERMQGNEEDGLEKVFNLIKQVANK
jgi:UDP-N-acetylglucosamine--N-acetylmuramyl-(pentapeptide) pyrophosphoryl-undecaprenol N-acetylglucosamine transferase